MATAKMRDGRDRNFRYVIRQIWKFAEAGNGVPPWIRDTGTVAGETTG